MSKQLVTTIDINASSDVIWSILTDFEQFSRWNPFIRSAAGNANKGAQLEIQIQPPDGNSMTFRPQVLIAEKPKELRWLGRFLFPGVFDGEHAFHIEPLAENRAKFTHSETFSGLLVPFLWRDLDTKTRAGFELMNQALKLRAEQYDSQSAVAL